MDKLKKYLVKSNIQQQEFAKTVQTSASNLSRILTGQQPPDLALAVRIERETKGQVRCQDWV